MKTQDKVHKITKPKGIVPVMASMPVDRGFHNDISMLCVPDCGNQTPPQPTKLRTPSFDLSHTCYKRSKFSIKKWRNICSFVAPLSNIPRIPRMAILPRWKIHNEHQEDDSDMTNLAMKLQTFVFRHGNDQLSTTNHHFQEQKQKWQKFEDNRSM